MHTHLHGGLAGRGTERPRQVAMPPPGALRTPSQRKRGLEGVIPARDCSDLKYDKFLPVVRHWPLITQPPSPRKESGSTIAPFTREAGERPPPRGSRVHSAAATSSNAFPWSTARTEPGLVQPSVPESCACGEPCDIRLQVMSFLLCGAQVQATRLSHSSGPLPLFCSLTSGSRQGDRWQGQGTFTCQ